MSYINELHFQQRRHPVKQLTGPEAVVELNRVVDQANANIARAVGMAAHYEAIAKQVEAENGRLKEELLQVHRELDRLRVEIGRLRRTRKGRKIIGD